MTAYTNPDERARYLAHFIDTLVKEGVAYTEAVELAKVEAANPDRPITTRQHTTESLTAI